MKISNVKNTIELDTIIDKMFPLLQESGQTYAEYRDANYDPNDKEWGLLTDAENKWFELEDC